jgi:hypothetical protein
LETIVNVRSNVKTKFNRPSSAGVLAFVLSTVLGALAGYGTSARAGDVRPTVIAAGAIWGAFVGIVVLLRFVQLSVVAKSLLGAVTGAVAAIACGEVMSWSSRATLLVAGIAGVVGATGQWWAKSANI